MYFPVQLCILRTILHLLHSLQTMYNWSLSLLIKPFVEQTLRSCFLTVVVIRWRSFFQTHKVMAIFVLNSTHSHFSMSTNTFDYHTLSNEWFSWKVLILLSDNCIPKWKESIDFWWLRLTNPQVWLELYVVLVDGHLLSFTQCLQYVGSAFLRNKLNLPDGFVDGHATHQARQVPHFFWTIFDVFDLMAHKLYQTHWNKRTCVSIGYGIEL